VPQVPARIAPGGLAVAAPAVSDIPHASAIGSPSASKACRTSIGIGAAPPPRCSAASSPSRAAASSPIPWTASCSFSQIRGTAPKIVGRTPGSWKITVRMSATDVSVKPSAIDAHQWLDQRSTTWAVGR
jgi:hypothetical protein